MTEDRLEKRQFQWILVEPSHPGNIGAVARAMDNFGFDRLSLIQGSDPQSPEAQAMACNAKEVLAQARRYPDLAEAVGESSLVIGVTARSRTFLQEPLEPKDLPGLLAQVPPGGEVAFLLGNERTGLENQHLSYCTHLLTIPTNAANPSLNLAQAALLLIWEVSKSMATAEQVFSNASELAISKEIEGFKLHLQSLLDAVGFYKSEDQRVSLNLSISDLAARARLTPRDVAMIRGMLHRIELALNDK